MKAFLAVLTVALVAQVSFASSIQRNKRDTDGEPNALDVLKEGLKPIISRLETVASEMPATDAYTKYKNEFEGIATWYHTKTRDVYCVEKVGNIYQKVQQLIEDLKVDKSEEAKKIVEIFKKYKSEDFGEGFEEAVDAAREPSTVELLNYC